MRKIEETRREMYQLLAVLKVDSKTIPFFEDSMELHLEALRQHIVALEQIQDENMAMIQKYEQDSKPMASVASPEEIHAEPSTPAAGEDQVHSPAHYSRIPGFESIDVIQAALTTEEFAGFCKGNVLKYRFRAGKKGPADICIGKADWYESRLKGGEIMKVEVKQGQVTIDGQAHLTIIHRGAVMLEEGEWDHSSKVHLKFFRFTQATQSTRLGRFLYLCRQVWEFSA